LTKIFGKGRGKNPFVKRFFPTITPTKTYRLKHTSKRNPLFSLTKEGAKKKANKKENAVKAPQASF